MHLFLILRKLSSKTRLVLQYNPLPPNTYKTQTDGNIRTAEIARYPFNIIIRSPVKKSYSPVCLSSDTYTSIAVRLFIVVSSPAMAMAGELMVVTPSWIWPAHASVWPCRCVPVGLEAARLNGGESKRRRGGVAAGGAAASCRMGVPKVLAGARQSGLKSGNLSGDPCSDQTVRCHVRKLVRCGARQSIFMYRLVWLVVQRHEN
jgi:hypothetical protein